jgi:DNA methylase
MGKLRVAINGPIHMKRNRLHSICPYFAMFPEQFVRKHVVAHTDRGDVVFDPFAGRGTTILESLLLDRGGFGTDLNPVAVCLSNAKANPPPQEKVLRRLRLLEEESQSSVSTLFSDPFFAMCFHENTLCQILHLRSSLRWRTDAVDCFIAAVALGVLHGEAHKTENCFSNRMPRTISTKKAYSIAWWTRHGFAPPKRDVFTVLRHMTLYRLATPIPFRRGRVVDVDARQAAKHFPDLSGRVSLIVTSPPYLDMTDYGEDQWLRQWFLGGTAEPTRGVADDRHRGMETYWRFLGEAWEGVEPLLAPEAVLVIRIGGTRVAFDDARIKLLQSLRASLGNRVEPLDTGFCSEIVGRQTNGFRPGTSGRRFEFDFRYRVST